MSRLVDVVLYSGERELLDLRLALLKADITIVLQSNKSFTGHDKPIFEIPKATISHVVENLLDSNPWQNEYALRRAGHAKLHELDLQDDDIIGFFDADEIPDPEIIRKTSDITAWNMDKYQMSLSWYQHKELTGISSSWYKVKHEDVSEKRRGRGTLPSVSAGWHLSSFMTLDKLQEKWRNISHTELIRPDMNEWVANCWNNGIAIENGSRLDQRPIVDLPSQFKKLPKFLKRVRPLDISAH